MVSYEDNHRATSTHMGSHRSMSKNTSSSSSSSKFGSTSTPNRIRITSQSPEKKVKAVSLRPEIRTELEEKCKYFSGGITWQRHVSSMEELYTLASQSEGIFHGWLRKIADEIKEAKFSVRSLTKEDIEALGDIVPKPVRTLIGRRPSLANPIDILNEAHLDPDIDLWFRCNSVCSGEINTLDGQKFLDTINLLSSGTVSIEEAYPIVRDLKFQDMDTGPVCHVIVEMPNGHLCTAIIRVEGDATPQEEMKKVVTEKGEERTEKTTGMALLKACKTGDTTTVDKLAKTEWSTFDINYVDEETRKTGLHYAVIAKNENMQRCLIKHKIDLRLKDRDGYTALTHAVLTKDISTIWLLISNGASVFARGSDGRSILDLALESRDVGAPAVSDFFSHYLDGPKSKTATADLLAELEKKKPEEDKIEEYLRQSADLFAGLEKGGPILHRLYSRYTDQIFLECDEVVKKMTLFLLEKECDVTQTDAQGLNCLEFLADCKKWDLAYFLMEETGLECNHVKPFLEPIRSGDMEDVKGLLTLRPAGLAKGPKGLLDLAIVSKNFVEPRNVSALLASHGATLEEPIKLIMEFATKGIEDVVEILLHYGADPNPDTGTFINVEVERSRKSKDLVRKLCSKMVGNRVIESFSELSEKASLMVNDQFVRATDVNGKTITAKAELIGDVPLPFILIFRRFSASPLDVAVQNSFSATAAVIYNAGGMVRESDLDQMLFAAAEEGNVSVCRTVCLAKAQLDPPIVDKLGHSALHLAAVEGHVSFVELLLDYKALPNSSTTMMGQTPLDSVFFCPQGKANRSEMMEVLISAEAEFKVVQPDQALISAAKRGDINQMEMLLPFVQDIDTRDPKSGKTAFLYTVAYGQVEALRMLKAHNADLSALDARGQSAKDICIKKIAHLKDRIDQEDRSQIGKLIGNCYGDEWNSMSKKQLNPELYIMLEVLLQLENSGCELVHYRKIHKGPPFPCKCHMCRTSPTALLYECAKTNRGQAAEELIELGAQVNPVLWGANPFSPLHIAAFSGSDSVIEILLEKKADINKPAQNTLYTPLHLAIIDDRQSAVEILVKKGASKELKSSSNLDAVELVRKHHAGKEDLLACL